MEERRATEAMLAEDNATDLAEIDVLKRRDVAKILGEPSYLVRGLVLLGAPCEGQGRDVSFQSMELAAWCEAEARNAMDGEAAVRWHRRAMRLAAHAADV